MQMSHCVAVRREVGSEEASFDMSWGWLKTESLRSDGGQWKAGAAANLSCHRHGPGIVAAVMESHQQAIDKRRTVAQISFRMTAVFDLSVRRKLVNALLEIAACCYRNRRSSFNLCDCPRPAPQGKALLD